MYSLINLVACQQCPSNIYTDDPYDTTQSGAGITFTRSEVVRLRQLLKRLPKVNSQLKTFQELLHAADGDLHLDMGAILPDPTKLRSRLMMDEQLRSEIMDMLESDVFPDDVEPWSEEDENLDPADIPEEVEDRNQTQGWEGCRVDYDMVIKPVTEGFRRDLIIWWNENINLCNVEVIGPGGPIDIVTLPIPEWLPTNGVARPSK